MRAPVGEWFTDLMRPLTTRASPDPGDMPTGWSPQVMHLAPMPLSTQRIWLDHLRPLGSAGRSSPVVTVDPYVLFDADTWDHHIEAMAGADILLLSEDELLLDLAADHRNRWFASGIPLVLFKQGAEGGTVYDAARSAVDRWQPRVGRVVDPTGAGDAFAGGLAAGLATGDPLDQALRRAVVSASFALEHTDVESFMKRRTGGGRASPRRLVPVVAQFRSCVICWHPWTT